MNPGQVISTILKHDSKVTSYKIALLRAINDVVLSFSHMCTQRRRGVPKLARNTRAFVISAHKQKKDDGLTGRVQFAFRVIKSTWA